MANSTYLDTRQRILFLDDYCECCCPAGHFADRRDRLAALTEPVAITWHGGRQLIVEYQCAICGHRWRRDDLWSASDFGLLDAA